MAQSANELKDKNQRGRKSTSNQMELSRAELMELDPMEVLEWEVERLEAGLNELEITIGASWTKSSLFRLVLPLLDLSPSRVLFYIRYGVFCGQDLVLVYQFFFENIIGHVAFS